MWQVAGPAHVKWLTASAGKCAAGPDPRLRRQRDPPVGGTGMVVRPLVF